jgi:excisionase family DNA binding protein
VPPLREFERWLTTSQAASKLGRSRQGVLWMLENGRLRGVKTQLGWLVDPEAVERMKEDELLRNMGWNGKSSVNPDNS